MSNEQRNFWSLPRYPALISLLEACGLLGLVEHQGRILVARGMLLPAGKRRRRKGRLFVSAYILELAVDREWLSKAKDTLSAHWEQPASRRKASSTATRSRCAAETPQTSDNESTRLLSGDGRFKNVPLGSNASEMEGDLLFETTKGGLAF